MDEILYLLGIDGAGKSTVARRLAAQYGLERTHPSWHWSAMPSLRRLAQRVTRTRPARQSRGDPAYYTAGLAIARRRRRLTMLYAWAWLLDGAWQARRAVAHARANGRPIVLGRYYLDIVIAASVLIEASDEAMLRLATRAEYLAPRAHAHLWLDVSEEVALTRKSDIHSIAYLRDRRARYRVIANAYGATRLDADQPLPQVLHDAAQAATALMPDLASRAGKANQG